MASCRRKTTAPKEVSTDDYLRDARLDELKQQVLGASATLARLEAQMRDRQREVFQTAVEGTRVAVSGVNVYQVPLSESSGSRYLELPVDHPWCNANNREQLPVGFVESQCEVPPSFAVGIKHPNSSAHVRRAFPHSTFVCLSLWSDPWSQHSKEELDAQQQRMARLIIQHATAAQ